MWKNKFLTGRNQPCFTVGDILASHHHLRTTHTHSTYHTYNKLTTYEHTPKIKPIWIRTHTHTCHGWYSCWGVGGVSVLLSRLNGGQARQACGLIHATRLFITIQRERSAVTSAQQPAPPTWCVRACVSVRGSVNESTVNPAHHLFSHGNKRGGPTNVLQHLERWEQSSACLTLLNPLKVKRKYFFFLQSFVT